MIVLVAMLAIGFGAGWSAMIRVIKDLKRQHEAIDVLQIRILGLQKSFDDLAKAVDSVWVCRGMHVGPTNVYQFRQKPPGNDPAA